MTAGTNPVMDIFVLHVQFDLLEATLISGTMRGH